MKIFQLNLSNFANCLKHPLFFCYHFRKHVTKVKGEFYIILLASKVIPFLDSNPLEDPHQFCAICYKVVNIYSEIYRSIICFKLQYLQTAYLPKTSHITWKILCNFAKCLTQLVLVKLLSILTFFGNCYPAKMTVESMCFLKWVKLSKLWKCL